MTTSPCPIKIKFVEMNVGKPFGRFCGTEQEEEIPFVMTLRKTIISSPMGPSSTFRPSSVARPFRFRFCEFSISLPTIDTLTMP